MKNAGEIPLNSTRKCPDVFFSRQKFSSMRIQESGDSQSRWDSVNLLIFRMRFFLLISPANWMLLLPFLGGRGVKPFKTTLIIFSYGKERSWFTGANVGLTKNPMSLVKMMAQTYHISIPNKQELQPSPLGMVWFIQSQKVVHPSSSAHDSGQIIIIHQPLFPWNKGSHFSSKTLPFGAQVVFSVAIIWPNGWRN